MNIVEIVLLAIVTFFFAIDQFSLTEIVYRPIIACPIIGAILGDVNTGLVVGGTYVNYEYSQIWKFRLAF